MRQTKKGNQWHLGMKADIGVDAQSGLVHTVVGTAASVSDVTQAQLFSLFGFANLILTCRWPLDANTQGAS